MFESCLEKQQTIKKNFNSCSSEEAKYQKMIEMGRCLPKMASEYKTADRIVKGCQSTVYLHAFLKDDKVKFEIESDALISAGLGAILLYVYDDETPETILKCPPTYLEDLGISASLTPSRANGLYSIHLRMKQEALKLLLEKAKHS